MGHFVLGITGAIGAGKSTVGQVLKKRGWSVLDVDDVAAAALVEVMPKLAPQRPAGLLPSGQPTKNQVFAAMLRDPDFRKELERQLRPFVVQRIRSWVQSLEGPGVVDAALLFESGLDEFCSATLCVQCPREQRRHRVRQRMTASAQHFEAIEAAQWSEAEKGARADAAIDNDGREELLEDRLRTALARLGLPF